jgi:hypothetical protein
MQCGFNIKDVGENRSFNIMETEKKVKCMGEVVFAKLDITKYWPYNYFLIAEYVYRLSQTSTLLFPRRKPNNA